MTPLGAGIRSRVLSGVIAASLAFSCARGEPKRKLPSESASPSATKAPSLPKPDPHAIPNPTAPPPDFGRPIGPQNVILITIDSLRADVPWQGYSRPIAPNLTRLAAESVVYTNAYAASSYTAKSVATMLTGRYASTLYRDGRFFTRYANSNLFLAEILDGNKVRNVAWHGHMYFGRNSGFEQGFHVWRLVPGLRFDSETDNDVTSDKMTELGIELLGAKETSEGRFFAWAHYMDPHDQYLKHPEAPVFGKKARDRYDAEIWFTDLHIGKLLDWAKTQPWWKDTAVIVTSDHGEAFGEHAMYKHAFELWEVLVRVPLFVYVPGVRPKRVEERRSHIDLAPTILDLMGVPIPKDFQGRSLAKELHGRDILRTREPILCELAHDSHNPPRRAAIEGRYKIIDFGRDRYELYDLTDDPGETKDLAKTHPNELSAMKAILVASFNKLPSIAPYGGTKLREGGRADGPSGPTPGAAPSAQAPLGDDAK